jgi:ankyrin repeat protein
MYVKKRLQDSYERSPEAWQRRSAAFNLAIESLSDSEPGKATKDCLDWLLKAAEMGNQSAQSIVYRFHITLIQTIPVDIFPQVKAWVMEAAARGYPAALEDMISLASPEECRLVKEKLRCRYAGIGQNRFASIYAALEATLDEGDTDIQEHLTRKFQSHSDSHDFNMAFGGGDNVLHFAASAGFLSVINLWHQPRPIDINSKGYGGETALLHACRAGHYEVTIALLGMGSDPTIACNNGDTPLHWLLSFDTQKVAEIASKLRAKGANPNAVAKSVRFPYAPECNYEAGTPLHRAVERGNIAAVRELLSIGAEADHSGGRPDAYTPLNVAAFLHRAEILGILLSSLSEPEPAAAVYAGMSLLAPAIGGEYFHGERFSKIARHGPSWWSQTSRTLEVLLEHGAEKHLHGFPAESIGAGVTALFVATTQGDAKVVEYFLTHGSLSDINVSSRYYPSDTLRSPLQKAISSRRNESFTVLLQYGADPCASHLDENGDRLTYLYECASSGHSDHSVAEKLVSRGVPVDEPGPADYETPFACAVRNRSFALASWLVQQGANPHVEYSRGFMFEMGYSHSLLGILIAEQSLSTLVCIDYLFGIVPQPKFVVASIRDYTALHAVARIKEAGRDDIALHLILLRLIEGFKPTTAQINQISQDGYTALHFAVINANVNVARTLLENGADPFIKSNDENSSFDYIQVTLPHVDEDPASYIDASDPRPEEDQVRLAKGRREGILRLLTEHSNKPNDSNHSS